LALVSGRCEAFAGATGGRSVESADSMHDDAPSTRQDLRTPPPGRHEPPPPATGDEEGAVRLHKFLAHAGIASRRRCEELIAEGVVRVNGVVVDTLPAWVRPETDSVSVKGKRIDAPERAIYVMLYKPKRVVSTAADPEGRRTVLDLVEHPAAARLYPVGRLDFDTMGLVLLTNDGELANKLTHPRFGVHKTYRAIVRGAVTDEEVQTLERGIFLAARRANKSRSAPDAERLGADRVEIVRREHERTILDITLAEGRNRQVRRLLSAIDHPVRKLTRIRMGPLSLKGLRVGEWRELTTAEVNLLRKAARRGERGGTTSDDKPAHRRGGVGKRAGRRGGRGGRRRR
jgi:pseudouridine synthase